MSPKISAGSRAQYVMERRNKILDASLRVFEQKGFSSARVAEIASAAGIAKGTVYLYFDSKEEILDAILTERSFLPHWANVIEKGRPLEVSLRNIAEAYFQLMEEYLPILRLVLTDAQRFPEHAQRVVREVMLKGADTVADFFASLAKAGEIRHLENPLLTARAFLGMFTTYILTQEVLNGQAVAPIDRQAWMDEAIQVFMDGLRV
jgi:TetR/AcrR family transcriptional regulator, cholesterol catabolism regulator